MSLLVAAGIFQHNWSLPALIPFCIPLGCAEVSSEMMSWAVQHYSVFEAKAWTSLLRAAAAKGQHLLLKIRQRIHVLRAFLSLFPCRGEALLAHARHSWGVLLWQIVLLPVETPWQHKMPNFLFPLWLSSYTLQRKKWLLSCRSLSSAVRGSICFPEHPSKLGFGYRGILCWAMQINKTKISQGWSPVWVFFSLKGFRFLDFVLFSFFIISGLFQKSFSHTVISQRMYLNSLVGGAYIMGCGFIDMLSLTK